MAEDTLHTIHVVASDPDFQTRLNAGAAKENAPGEPANWVWTNRYEIAAAPGWAAAVDYWLLSNPDGGNGWALDVSVISDLQIVSQIQQLLAPPVPEQEPGP